MILYKYRSLNNFRFFTDIILNQRLYAATFFELNDPMEGHYFYHSGEVDFDIRKKILYEKKKIRICSLSRDHDNELMWSHYAEGHRGVVIGIEIKDQNNYNLRSISYDGLALLTQQNINSYSTFEFLSHKLEIWKYEKEERIFSPNKYIPIFIKEVLIGRRMSKQDKGFIKKFINKINPDILIKNVYNYLV